MQRSPTDSSKNIISETFKPLSASRKNGMILISSYALKDFLERFAGRDHHFGMVPKAKVMEVRK
ncbi:MAG: hypothetical protein QXR19_09760 [Candidatus Jordarchaeaceae archaeon]